MEQLPKKYNVREPKGMSFWTFIGMLILAIAFIIVTAIGLSIPNMPMLYIGFFGFVFTAFVLFIAKIARIVKDKY
ncbi:MAG: hypothetical protein FWE45_00815 [Firmicutes bacterium]|nr:hypothetical protein [Bacillota bacterium]